MVFRMLNETRSICLGANSLLLIIILLLCIYNMYEKNVFRTLQETWNLLILTVMFLIVCAVVFKIRLFFEELFYINSYYQGNFLSVLKATMNFNIPSWILIAITSISFLMFVINSNFPVLQIIQFKPLATLLAFAFSLLVLYSINILECKVTKAGTIFSSGGLDPGTSMACSYFYGYLKIMLPASGGNERVGMLKALENYESNHKIEIPVKKLFILIPSSSYIPPDLREVSDNCLEFAGSLETIVLDRAGVKNRPYHNTVYRIRNRRQQGYKFTYVATEGATPLKTFLEVQDKSHRYSPLYREYNKEIVRNFYKTLKNLLYDNPDCRDFCELVYYEDFVDGQRVNPAKVLLERINQYTQSNESFIKV